MRNTNNVLMLFLLGGASAAVLLCSFTSVHAQVVGSIIFTEIMYDPKGADDGHEWLEIENTTDSDVDLASWSISMDSVRHKIESASGATSTPLIVPAHLYAIIAVKPPLFSADNPSYVGLVFHSSFSLKNTEDTVSLLAKAVTIDTVSYTATQGGKGNGDSLQRYADGSWHEALPTPGSAALVPVVASTPAVPVSVPEATISEATVTTATSTALSGIPEADSSSAIIVAVTATSTPAITAAVSSTTPSAIIPAAATTAPTTATMATLEAIPEASPVITKPKVQVQTKKPSTVKTTFATVTDIIDLDQDVSESAPALSLIRSITPRDIIEVLVGAVFAVGLGIIGIVLIRVRNKARKRKDDD
jgi:Lamin Tail Domain